MFIIDQAGLMDAREFADSKGVRKELEDKISYLDSYGGEGTVCKGYYNPFDLPQGSIGLTFLKDGKVWMTGGLVFHGDSYSVHT